LHITILALGSTGDILPYAALGHHLKSVGYDVLFVTSENFEGLISGLGINFLGIPGNAQAIVRSNSANIFSLFRSFAELSKGLTIILDPEHPEIGRTDLILNQLPIGLYGYDLAEKLDVPMIQASVIPLTPTRAFPMMGWPAVSSKIPGFNRLSFRVYEQMTWLYMRRTVNHWRQEKLGLPQRPIFTYWKDGQPGRPETIYGFSNHVLSKPVDWGDRIHICGNWYLDDNEWKPPKYLTAFLENGDPPVFIGFGSMPLSHPVRTTEMLVKAVKLSGQRAILHAGWAGIGGVRLPDSILLIDYAPYHWLLPKMAAVIHHGGSGTTGRTLWAGVPSIIVPFLFDQFFWGRRVASLGTGLKPIRFKKLNAQNLSESIDRLVNDQAIRIAALKMGENVKAESGLENAEGIIQELVAAP
jgi:UDP:flavonoid glycosyltransferase YjiC (YdhE family)